MIITGRVPDNGAPTTELYENLGNFTFSKVITSPQLQDLYNGSVKLGDFNNDNNLDILLTGSLGPDNSPYSILYLNLSNNEFEARSSPVKPLAKSNEFSLYRGGRNSMDLLDFNNDGLLDIILSGTDFIADPATLVYLNNNKTDFVLSDYNLPGLMSAELDFTDFEKDYDWDILYNGVDLTGKYVW